MLANSMRSQRMRQLVGLGMIKREKPKAQKGYVIVNSKHKILQAPSSVKHGSKQAFNLSN